ncbi:integrator complex subunit 3 isoform X3 [Petromyzon marinus]|uniref:Integrator complex subunit 3 isoform X3 n=1 Tax=Petromyzon marinus TaxID=7757 RepID=A0AAJ7T1C3_PETMA|nr:integrator complex subunit 3 isoform X3 [Petromyzon marinus]
MEVPAKHKGKMIASNALDAKDELEEVGPPASDSFATEEGAPRPAELGCLARGSGTPLSKLDRCMATVTSMIVSVSEREANDALTAHVCKGAPQHEETCLGLTAIILTDPAQAARCYRDLTLVSRDGLGLVLAKVNQLLMEKFLKMHDVARNQLVWLVREVVKNGVIGADGVTMTLLKQIAGGDTSPKNIWLAETVLDLLTDYREWVLKNSLLVSMTVYTFLRIIVDHNGSPALTTLRQKEVDFCITLLRERFADCTMIGRDLVRLLQNVARIPEIEKLWRDMLHNPQSLSPQFTGILQLLQMRTSRKFLACRLTPDMETKLLFMMSKVRFGQQKRYQDWFQRQYLSTPDSQSLRCDLIRYICGVVHPSNEVLCSDILPRWALIGWLLTTCTSNVAATNAKLSLFYDWLFFQPDKDSIMNIEPAILVMHHSMRPHPAITATLLDFMCRIMPNFYPPLESLVRQGVYSSLRSILEKRVLQSLSPLFDNPKLDRELRSMIRENFSEFTSSPSPPMEGEKPLQPQLHFLDEAVKADDLPSTMEPDNHVGERGKDECCFDATEATFSDEEEEEKSKGKKVELRFRPIREAVSEEPLDVTLYLEQLDESLRDKVLALQKESDTETQCEIMQAIVEVILQMDDFDAEMACPLACCLIELFREQFHGEVLPEEITEESLEESVGKPIYVIFRNLCQFQEDDDGYSVLLTLMSELYQKQPKIGYHLLYYLQASKAAEGKTAVYESFAQSTQLGDIFTCLMLDMKACQEDDVRLLCYLVPPIYTKFDDVALGNSELLNMIVAAIDSLQLQEMVCQVMLGNLVMFRKDSALNVLTTSLQWETFEQYCTWQLFLAHGIPIETVVPILQHLKYKDHPEALSCLLLQLRREKPMEEMVKLVLSRPCHREDHFTTSILRHWAVKHEEILAEHVKSLLIKNNTPPRKRQSLRSSSSKLTQLTVEQMLEHLDNLRLVCSPRQTFFAQTPILQALQHVQASCDEGQKSRRDVRVRFSDLFALAEDFEDSSKPTRNRRKGAAATSPRSKKAPPPASNEEESSGSSQSEEEDTKPKTHKRKRKPSAMGSDSD